MVPATLEAVDILGLMKLLPHRYPFLMIDRIVDIDGDNSAIGIKNVTINEPHFQGHFPDQPVMPGVLIVEAMAQTAGAICIRSLATRKAVAGLFPDHRQREIPQAGRAGRPVEDPRQENQEARQPAQIRLRGHGGRRKGRGSRDLGDDGHQRLTDRNAHENHRLQSIPRPLSRPALKSAKASRIGPFCHVGADAVIGDRVELVSHVSVHGRDHHRRRLTKVYPMAILGGPPQNTKHKGGRTTLVIGENCTIREGVTMHLGTDSSRGETTVGDNGNFLAYAHIAHDCVVGNNATFANGATLGGHCEIGDNVYIGGLSAVHQFVRVGDNAFLGGCSAVVGDVIPYAIAVGNRASLRGLNIIGLKRSGVPRAEIHVLRKAYRMIFDRSRTVGENIELAKAEFASSPTAMKIIDFITSRGKRHFAVPSLKGGAGDDADDED